MTPSAFAPGTPAAPRQPTGDPPKGSLTPEGADDADGDLDDLTDTAERPKIDLPPPVDRDRLPLAESVPMVAAAEFVEPEIAAADITVPVATPLDQQPSPPPASAEKSRGRLIGLVLLGLFVLFLVVYVAVAAMGADKLPRGTTVSGVEVGGMTRDEAEQALTEGLAARSKAPLDVTIDGQPRAITPESAGLGVDYAASIDELDTTTWAPASVWNYLFGGDDEDAVVTVDDVQLATVLNEVAAEVASPATEGGIEFNGTEVVVTEPKTGRALDTAEAAAAVQEAYLDPEANVDLSLADAPPEIDEADVQTALDSFANPAVSGPVTLEFDDLSLTLSPNEFTPLLSMRPQGGSLVPVVKAKKLTALAEEEIGEAGAPVDATVKLVDGRPRIVKGKPGLTYAPPDVASALVTAAADASGNRQQAVTPTKTKPDFTTKDAKALGIRRRVSSFTTYYPYAAYRNVNIPRAAVLVNGTLLKPGETFSLNDTVGERTVANGFTTGFIISGGLFAEDLGGGVSQMATTTFNAMFFAGLKDIEHKPHSFFIDRYPEGREATVAWGSVDLRFKNDTPYGVLIQANVTPATPSSSGVVTVSMWSTKFWDITTSTSARYNFTSPGTRTLTTDNCVPNVGYGGFEVDVQRFFRKPGQSALVRDESFHTKYIPADTVICKPPDEEETP